MSKTRSLLIPQYIKKFRCIGTECEDNCCIGWQVDIDRNTYRKYQRMRDLELRGTIERCVRRNRSNSTPSTYARVINSDTACPFLTEKRLCRIQVMVGEEHLSDVCSTYPRMTAEVNGVLERSATMSCPEAARLALLNPKVMEFDEIQESIMVRNIIRARLDTNHQSMAEKPERYFWELRTFTIGVLQNRRYALAERLIILGLFYQHLQQRLEIENIHDIPALIGTFLNLMEADGLKEQLEGIPTQAAVQMELLKELTDERVVKGVSSQRYLECFAQFLSGIQYTKEACVEEITARYRNAEEKYYRPFMEQRDYILENYLVNYVFENCFPLLGDRNLFENYVMMVIHYALIKMHCIGMAGYHRGLTEDLCIKLIQSFAKTVEHDNKYLQRVLTLLKNNNFTTMAYMAILIKN